jgi:hypothetical protein
MNFGISDDRRKGDINQRIQGKVLSAHDDMRSSERGE